MKKTIWVHVGFGAMEVEVGGKAPLESYEEIDKAEAEEKSPPKKSPPKD